MKTAEWYAKSYMKGTEEFMDVACDELCDLFKQAKAEAYRKGQEDMRERVLTVQATWPEADELYDAIRELPIKELEK